jgi:hypothetical protein
MHALEPIVGDALIIVVDCEPACGDSLDASIPSGRDAPSRSPDVIEHQPSCSEPLDCARDVVSFALVHDDDAGGPTIACRDGIHDLLQDRPTDRGDDYRQLRQW